MEQRGFTILHQAHQPENLKKFFRRKPVVVNITQIIFISAKIKAELKTFKTFCEFFCFAYNVFLFPSTLFKKMFYVKVINFYNISEINFYNISESICRKRANQEIDGISLVTIHQYLTYININFRCRI